MRSSADDPFDWIVNAENRNEVEGLLRRVSADYKLFYEFEVDATDAIDRIAAYLSIDTFTPGIDTSKSAILKTPADFSLAATKPLIDSLGDITAGLSWTKHENFGELFKLSGAAELPDPVKLPGIHRVQKLTTGRWEASYDGRALMTSNNLKTLSSCGIAWITSFSDYSDTYQQEPFPVFSGNLLQTLKRAGASVAAYLPPEDFEITPW
ncbi:hypothetical protein [Saccharopolyspora antimicrobica]|uniref:hypothetical protein n=1 Tax=Saccharopolyspora antimicrobica TaxID=455193 RepID=UPI000B822AC8|nr:hypothetical protein [Saccharopolyspora antimicrobica]